MNTYLFFPIEVGIAHIARCFAVAEELGKRGNTVIIALPKRKQNFYISTKNVQIVDIAPYVEQDCKVNVGSFTNYEFLKKIVKQEIELIRKYKPDAVVVDFRLSALSSSIIADCPNIFFIANSDALPNAPFFPNTGFSNALYKFGLPIVQTIFKLGMRNYLSPLIKICEEAKCKISYEEFLGKINFLIAESEGYWPGNNQKLKLHYVSPISWSRFEDARPEWIENIYPNGKTIYLTFGGTGFDKDRLIKLSYKLQVNGFRVLVSTGDICEPSEFRKLDNLFVAKYLPGNEVSRRVDFIICHGGHGTMSEAIANGKPVIAIPYNPDQIVHATRMQELGLGICLVKLNLIGISKVFLLNWKKIEDIGKRVKIPNIIFEAKKMSQNLGSYEIIIKKFNKNTSNCNGAIIAADVVERTCSPNH